MGRHKNLTVPLQRGYEVSREVIQFYELFRRKDRFLNPPPSFPPPDGTPDVENVSSPVLESQIILDRWAANLDDESKNGKCSGEEVDDEVTLDLLVLCEVSVHLLAVTLHKWALLSSIRDNSIDNGPRGSGWLEREEGGKLTSSLVTITYNVYTFVTLRRALLFAANLLSQYSTPLSSTGFSFTSKKDDKNEIVRFASVLRDNIQLLPPLPPLPLLMCASVLPVRWSMIPIWETVTAGILREVSLSLSLRPSDVLHLSHNVISPLELSSLSFSLPLPLPSLVSPLPSDRILDLVRSSSLLRRWGAIVSFLSLLADRCRKNVSLSPQSSLFFSLLTRSFSSVLLSLSLLFQYVTERERREREKEKRKGKEEGVDGSGQWDALRDELEKEFYFGVRRGNISLIGQADWEPCLEFPSEQVERSFVTTWRHDISRWILVLSYFEYLLTLTLDESASVCLLEFLRILSAYSTELCSSEYLHRLNVSHKSPFASVPPSNVSASLNSCCLVYTPTLGGAKCVSVNSIPVPLLIHYNAVDFQWKKRSVSKKGKDARDTLRSKEAVFDPHCSYLWRRREQEQGRYGGDERGDEGGREEEADGERKEELVHLQRTLIKKNILIGNSDRSGWYWEYLLQVSLFPPLRVTHFTVALESSHDSATQPIPPRRTQKASQILGIFVRSKIVSDLCLRFGGSIFQKEKGNSLAKMTKSRSVELIVHERHLLDHATSDVFLSFFRTILSEMSVNLKSAVHSLSLPNSNGPSGAKMRCFFGLLFCVDLALYGELIHLTTQGAMVSFGFIPSTSRKSTQSLSPSIFLTCLRSALQSLALLSPFLESWIGRWSDFHKDRRDEIECEGTILKTISHFLKKIEGSLQLMESSLTQQFGKNAKEKGRAGGRRVRSEVGGKSERPTKRQKMSRNQSKILGDPGKSQDEEKEKEDEAMGNEYSGPSLSGCHENLHLLLRHRLPRLRVLHTRLHTSVDRLLHNHHLRSEKRALDEEEGEGDDVGLLREERRHAKRANESGKAVWKSVSLKGKDFAKDSLPLSLANGELIFPFLPPVVASAFLNSNATRISSIWAALFSPSPHHLLPTPSKSLSSCNPILLTQISEIFFSDLLTKLEIPFCLKLLTPSYLEDEEEENRRDESKEEERMDTETHVEEWGEGCEASEEEYENDCSVSEEEEEEIFDMFDTVVVDWRKEREKYS
jgi:hypothetical protein